MRSRRGASALEFALVLPVLATFVLGSMEISWFFHQQLVITEAASAGARAGSLTAQADGVEDAARTATKAVLSNNLLDAESVTISISETTDTLGDQQLEVNVAFAYVPLFDYTPSPDTVSAVAIARLLDQ